MLLHKGTFFRWIFEVTCRPLFHSSLCDRLLWIFVLLDRLILDNIPRNIPMCIVIIDDSRIQLYRTHTGNMQLKLLTIINKNTYKDQD